MRARCIPAPAGVRPPFRRLQVTQQVTMFSQSFRPPCATGTTRSNVTPLVGSDSAQSTPAGGGRHDMVERELARRIRVAAVLARVVVARVDVRPRKWHVIEASFDLDV